MLLKKSNKDAPKGISLHPPPKKKQAINHRFLNVKACLVALLFFVFLSATAFGQGGSASLTGTILDPSGGLVPNANVTIRNVDTGVETRTTSNNAGIYNFPSLPVGTYELTADASGFSRTTRSDLRLNVGSQARYDVSLAIAGTVTEIAVSGEVESVILEAGSSTGTVISQEILTTLPILNNSMMDLITLMGGVTPQGGAMNAYAQTFAGLDSRQINITRDGMSVNEIRVPSGINSASNVNMEMVGEFRMVLSPVDAEMGRGGGQIQMTTRSGSNAFHGSGVWNVQNTALDAWTFAQKLNNTPRTWRNMNNYMLTASGPVIKNRTFFFVTWEQQFSISKAPYNAKVLTPCAKKGIYRYIDGWIPSAASENNSHNPTNYTRPSVDLDGKPLLGGNFYNTQSQTEVSYPNSELRFESVFGPLDPTVRAVLANPSNPHGAFGDCEDLNFNGMNGQYGVTGPWDTRAWAQGGRAYQYQYDPTGFVDRFTNGVEGIVRMPDANTYTTGDGLNYAVHRWTRTTRGTGGSIYGIGGQPQRRSITFKLDHNINNEHRLSGTYSFEKYLVDDGEPQWPKGYGSYGGTITRRPQSFLVSLTSTLAPTLINEVRFGLMRALAYSYTPLDDVDGDKMREVLRALMPSSYYAGSGAANMDLLIGTGEAPLLFHTDPTYTGNTQSHPFGSRGNIPVTQGGFDKRWTVADTITWMKGTHSFKGGVEYRLQTSNQEKSGSIGFSSANPAMGIGSLTAEPSIFGGASDSVRERRRTVLGAYGPGGSMDDGVSWRGVSANSRDDGLANPNGNYSLPYAMMTYFSGAIAEARQFFYAVPDANYPNGARWNDVSLGENYFSQAISSQEIHFFFKDDWKVNNSLTLNLGIRYEYYGVPYVKDGRTLAMVGGSKGIWGITNPGFDTWMKNRQYVKTAPGVVPDPVTAYQYVGPDSQHPDLKVWNRDLNNFAPHLGFAWQLPWFGKGLTTLRGGWSVSYAQIQNFEQLGVQIAEIGGATPTTTGRYYGVGEPTVFGTDNYYMDLTSLSSILPMSGNLFNVEPMKPLEVGRFYEATFNAVAHDDNIRNPYVHSFNMSLTRNIGRNLTVDVRYVGTMSRDQISSPGALNLNQPNFIDNGLYKEFEIVRAGGQSAVINSLIPQNGPSGGQMYLVNNAPNLTGSEQLRSTAGPTYSYLVSGAFNSLANSLVTTNGQLSERFSGDRGNLLREGCLPEDRPGYLTAFAADPMTNVHNYPCTYVTPWNYIYVNPQHSTTGYSYNSAIGNYHSMQAQISLRPTKGLSMQANYTWSRTLSTTTAGWTNYYRDRDYNLAGGHRSHTLNTFGSFELPFGANGFFLRDASGAFKKAIEGWQLSWIIQLASGTPSSVTGLSTMWGNSYPVLVRPDLWNEKGGKVTETWENGRFIGGKYFGDNFAKVLDRNICNPATIFGDANTPGTLYYQSCEQRTNNGAQVLTGPRALALSSGEIDASGNLLPVRYSSLEEARRYDPTAQMDVIGFNQEPDGSWSPVYANPAVIIFRNANQLDFDPANPGKYLGNYKQGRISGVGTFSFDLAMSKSIEFMEGKRFEVRVDAQNILNHPTVSGAGFAINSTAVFGNFTSKSGSRTFQGKLRLSF